MLQNTDPKSLYLQNTVCATYVSTKRGNQLTTLKNMPVPFQNIT